MLILLSPHCFHEFQPSYKSVYGKFKNMSTRLVTFGCVTILDKQCLFTAFRKQFVRQYLTTFHQSSLFRKLDQIIETYLLKFNSFPLLLRIVHVLEVPVTFVSRLGDHKYQNNLLCVKLHRLYQSPFALNQHLLLKWIPCVVLHQNKSCTNKHTYQRLIDNLRRKERCEEIHAIRKQLEIEIETSLLQNGKFEIKRCPLPSRTVQKQNTSNFFLENSIQIRRQMNSRYYTVNVRIELTKNVLTQVTMMFVFIIKVLIMFVFIVTRTTTFGDTFAFL